MTSNEERIARLEGIAEVTASRLNDIQAEISDIRGEMRAMRQELYTEIRSGRNTLLMVSLLMWITTIGTLLGLFFGVR